MKVVSKEHVVRVSPQPNKPKGITKVKSLKSLLASSLTISKQQVNLLNASVNQNYNKSNNQLLTSVNVLSDVKNILKTEGDLKNPSRQKTIKSLLYSAKQQKQNNPANFKTIRAMKQGVKNIHALQKSNSCKNILDIHSLKIINNKEREKQSHDIDSKTLTRASNNDSENSYLSQNNSHKQPKRINYYKNHIVQQNLAAKQKIYRKNDLNINNFKMGKKLGKGRFGSVHIVQEKYTGLIYALKIIDLKQLKEQQMQGQLMQQIKLQLYMNHPNITKLYGYFRDQQNLCLLLEYAVDKCLFFHLHSPMNQIHMKPIVRQVVQSLRYCHSQCVLHRDLKPENILLNFGVVKLADFGWAAYAPKFKRTTFCGTLDYVPPQILKGDQYDQKVDIWSLGVLLYQMAVGKAPFQSFSINPQHSQEKTMDKIIEGNLNIPYFISEQLRQLIQYILRMNPILRPSLNIIESHRWLSRDKYEIDIRKEIWQFWIEITQK